MQFVQGFHLIATALFVLGSAIVGIRLLWLAQRTRQAPELLLGGAIFLTAVLGYGVLIVATAIGSTATSGASPAWLPWLSGFGKISHDVGVTLFLVFVVRVFRPGAAWAWSLAGAAALLLWTGLVWGALEGSFQTTMALTGSWWCEYSVIFTYSLWLAIEAFRYWGLMRKRAALGLADPMVTNRFLLWGTGSLFTFAATMIASVPFFLMKSPDRMTALAPTIYVGTAVAGVVSISCSYLAFLPPAWFTRAVRARAERHAQTDPQSG
jgi:hypothetical protein